MIHLWFTEESYLNLSEKTEVGCGQTKDCLVSRGGSHTELVQVGWINLKSSIQASLATLVSHRRLTGLHQQ